MIPFIDNDVYKSYDRYNLKCPHRKPLLFLKSYTENNEQKWEYIVETIKGKQFIRYWKNILPTPEEYYAKKEPSKKEMPLRDEEKHKRREYKIQERRRKLHEEFVHEDELWNASPLSIKLYGNKEKYNPNFSDEENAAMYYCSEWLRKCIKFKNESIFETCQRLYKIDIQKIQNRMSESSSNKTTGKKYSWYIIQPYVYEKENKIYHYMPKTIIRALYDDNVERRMRITPELEPLYGHLTNANILYKGNSYKEVKLCFNDFEEKNVDKKFIEEMKFTFIKDNKSYFSYEFDNENYNYVYRKQYVSDDEFIKEQIDSRIRWLKKNEIYRGKESDDAVKKAVEEKYLNKYNIDAYLKNFSNCYNYFSLNKIKNDDISNKNHIIKYSNIKFIKK